MCIRSKLKIPPRFCGKSVEFVGFLSKCESEFIVVILSSRFLLQVMFTLLGILGGVEKRIKADIKDEKFRTIKISDRRLALMFMVGNIFNSSKSNHNDRYIGDNKTFNNNNKIFVHVRGGRNRSSIITVILFLYRFSMATKIKAIIADNKKE